MDAIQAATPARLYALGVGGALTVLGVGGFFWGASFETGQRAIRADLGEVLGILAVNGPTNLLHLATGLIGLALARHAARNYALAAGLLYIVLAIWGLLVIERGVGEILGVVAVDSAENLLHLAIGLAGVAAGAATPVTEKRSRRTEPAERTPAA